MAASTTSAHGAETAAIRTPPSDRAEQHRDPRRALEEGARLPDQRLVLADQLRDDHLLRREVRPRDRAEQEREDDERREASLPSQCSTGIASISGARTASARTIVRHAPIRRSTAPPGIPSAASPTQLGADDERSSGSPSRSSRGRTTAARATSSGRRSSRRPRRRAARRRGAGGAASSGSDQPATVLLHDVPVELDARARAPEVLDDVPVDRARRSSPPRSGRPLPRARWTVPSIFSSNSVFRM